jgi:hypothetical protein
MPGDEDADEPGLKHDPQHDGRWLERRGDEHEQRQRNENDRQPVQGAAAP